ncbi:hypothetical protein KJZ61_03400 [Candidatus Dependentiae bacterium]|nr:hypothetical protein [Candidatus Dependentiae bacterium]
MKRILIALAVLFVMVLNIRTLFGESVNDINTEIDVYGAWTVIKDYFYTPKITGTDTNLIASDTKQHQELVVHEDVAVTTTLSKEFQTIAIRNEKVDPCVGVGSSTGDNCKYAVRYGSSRFYQQRFDSAVDDFRQSNAWCEMGIQQITNLLKLEMAIVNFLSAESGYELEKAVEKRNQRLEESAPIIVHMYDVALDLATYHPKLEPESYKNKHGEITMFSGNLTRREKKLYLQNVHKILHGITHDLSSMQLGYDA